MTWFYFYIFIDQWPEYEALGWELAGNMRPDNWASPNKGNLIVRKKAEGEIGENTNDQA
jgi:hypothetical protein